MHGLPHGLVHGIAAMVVVPYLALALLFVLIGQAARTQGLWALIDTVVNQAGWLARWGFYAAALLWVGLLVMGFVPRLQRSGSLCLGLLALGSLVAIVALHSTRIGLGQLTFLLPCVAVAASSAWLYVRAGRALLP